MNYHFSFLKMNIHHHSLTHVLNIFWMKYFYRTFTEEEKPWSECFIFLGNYPFKLGQICQMHLRGRWAVCVFVLHPLVWPYRRSETRVLSSVSKTDQANFTDWMSWSNLMEKISTNTDALSANTQRLSATWKIWNDNDGNINLWI